MAAAVGASEGGETRPPQSSSKEQWLRAHSSIKARLSGFYPSRVTLDCFRTLSVCVFLFVKMGIVPTSYIVVRLNELIHITYFKWDQIKVHSC